MESGDVVIIGAGLIGLSLAFELAGRGATVRLLDRGEPGKAASWAGAGMLAPYTERIADPALHQLCERSLRMYPAFAATIRDISGIDAHLQLDGILSVVYERSDTNEHSVGDAMRELEMRCVALRERGVACEVLDRERTLLAEPALGKHVAGSILVHGEGQVDNRRLGRALVAACERRGIILETNVNGVNVECDERKVLGVRTSRGFLPAGAVVNAAGAWAAQVAGVPASCVPPVVPVKGQMLTVEIPRGFMRHVTWVPGAYLVPRPDGRLLIGATVEHVGYDMRVTAAGVHQLLHAAIAAAPALEPFTVSETWAGLRPGTSDERPLLGPTSMRGYFLATGHYRNGILLAPATAVLLADAIEGKGSEPAFSNLVA